MKKEKELNWHMRQWDEFVLIWVNKGRHCLHSLQIIQRHKALSSHTRKLQFSACFRKFAIFRRWRLNIQPDYTAWGLSVLDLSLLRALFHKRLENSLCPQGNLHVAIQLQMQSVNSSYTSGSHACNFLDASEKTSIYPSQVVNMLIRDGIFLFLFYQTNAYAIRNPQVVWH